MKDVVKNEQTIRWVEQMEREYHLTEPYIVKYGRWLKSLILGEWGESIFKY